MTHDGGYLNVMTIIIHNMDTFSFTSPLFRLFHQCFQWIVAAQCSEIMCGTLYHIPIELGMGNIIRG